MVIDQLCFHAPWACPLSPRAASLLLNVALYVQALECRKEEAKKACVEKGLEIAATDSARQALVSARHAQEGVPMLGST